MSVTLTTLENLQGALTLVAVLVSIVLGLSIISKYFKFKDKNLIFVGITWIGMFSPYWGDAISYAIGEAKKLEELGYSGVMVENFSDAPFVKSRVSDSVLIKMSIILNEMKKNVKIPNLI